MDALCFVTPIRVPPAASYWLTLLLCLGATLPVASQNGIFQEVYSGISGSTVATLTNAMAFPGSPSSTNVLTTSFEAAVNTADNYGQRLRSLIVAPTSGAYVFWIASDDQSVLYLSSDESPANKIQIASVTSATASRGFTTSPTQQSTNLTLVAGQRYYIEVLHKEGTGSDNLAVRWRLPGGTIEEPIPASRCRPYGVPASIPPAINQQPTNVTVIENSPASFRLVITNLDAVTYQWQRSGTNLPGLTGATLTLTNATLGDHGSVFRCVVSNSLGMITSAVATLSVAVDAVAPVLSSVANLNSNAVLVTFSEPLEADSATNKSNYSLSGGITVSNVAFVSGSTRAVQLITSPMIFGTNYTLSVSGVRDRAATPNTIAVASQLSFPALLKGIYREVFTNIGGNFLLDLTNSPAYPNAPTSAELLSTTCETTNNLGDSYGQRLRAQLIPPTTGSYVFWIAADENATLYLGTNSSPGSARAIATSSNSASRLFDSPTNQQSAPINLVGGQLYHFEVLMKEGVGNDNLAVRWQWPDGSIEEPIPGYRFTPVGLMPPTITQQPTNLIALEGVPAVFAVTDSNPDPVTFQWQRNGTNIVGATNASYTNASVQLSDHGAAYRCLLSNAMATTFSATATLSVVADLAPPQMTNALNQGLTNVVVFFSELIQTNSATNRLNYAIPGVTISAATLRAGGRSVMLSTTPLVLGGLYTVTVNSIRDRAAAANIISTNSQRSFVAREFFPEDIGTLASGTVITSLSGGVNVTSAGADIGGTNDQCGFAYQLRTGDFDVQVRLARLDFADTWTEAALMARESLAPGSRHASTVATPSLAGCYFAWRDTSNATASSSGTFPANPPNTWLRLARASNTFSGFASLDGQTWTRLGSVTSALPATLYLGFAAASHNATAATAEFREFSEVTNAAAGTIAVSVEPPGPCSRRTALVISEIMYHPAERADGRSGEFVELFNSNPFPDDLSGYRLSGDIDFTFPPGTTIRGGESLVIARDVADAQFLYGLGNVLGPYQNNLPNSSGTLRLRNNRDAVLLEIEYNSRAPWPAAADGSGHSLVLARPSLGEGNALAWAQSDQMGGSPGMVDGVRFEAQRNVLINEFLAHTDLPDVDYIELYNHSMQPVDLSGCWLSDDPATNKFRIPNGTTIGVTGFLWFTEATLGFSLSSAGEAIYLVNSNRTRVLDSVRFDGQENGVSTGRFPDGAPLFSRLAAQTLGGPNAPLRADAIVINEIMYNPISGQEDDEFVELYNRSASPVDLSSWRCSDGIDFMFATNTLIPADGYLVVARNRTNLLARHGNLNSANCVGDFSGSLRNSGERIALSMPDSNVTTNGMGVAQTNVFFIVMDEVTYGTGGRCGQWSDGGGSSLELIDPRADNRLAPSWADSDDTAKSVWTTVTATGTLDNSAYTNWNTLQFWMQDAGEALVDEASVTIAGSSNLVTNPGFEAGLNNWFAQGNQGRSSLENSGYFSGSSLHLRATARGDTGPNRIRTTLSSSYSNSVTGTISAKVKWLHGRPEILFRLGGNHLEAPGALLVPTNLGTPGARNSRFVTNAGPAILEIAHAPILPAAGENVIVTARLHDADGLDSAQLMWRVDPAGTTNTLALLDNGTGGDAVAGDGIFSAMIPGQTNGAVVAFFIQATDGFSPPVTTRFPSDAPMRECLVRFGETLPIGTFGTYRFWLTASNFSAWLARTEKLSNEPFDGTFVVGNFRVIYNAGARYAGSPFHSPGYSSPLTANCDYQITLPGDDTHLAETEFTLQLPGNGGGDSTGQGQQTAYWFARRLGIPFNHHRYVNMFLHGVKHGTIMEDVQQPSADHERQWFPGVDDGDLYKIQLWFEFNATSYSPFGSAGASLARFTTTGGVKKLARYRQNWGKRAVKQSDSASNYTNIFNLVDTLATTNNPADSYLTTVGAAVDYAQWSRVFAVQRIIGNGDSYGNGGGQNMYIYKAGSAGKWNLLLWDIDFAFSSAAPTSTLLTFSDAPVTTLFSHPLVRRTYWQVLEDCANDPLFPANVNPFVDAKYDALRASGIGSSAPTAIKNYAAMRRDHILAQLSTVRAPLSITNNAGADFTNASTVVTLAGTAPIGARTLLINGQALPLSWTSISNWAALVTLASQTNLITVQALDAGGAPLSSGTDTVTVYFNGPVARAEDSLVINEILFNPATNNAAFVEIFNRSTNTTFELGQFRLKGVDFDFTPGTLIAPRGYLVVVENLASYQSAYGTNAPVAGVFNGQLDTDGETLTLIRREGTNEVIIDKVKYDVTPPWPPDPAMEGSGVALQLIDPAQDNARVSNWGDGLDWRFFSYTGTPNSSRLLLFPDVAGDLYIDDIMLVAGSIPGVGTNLIRNGDFESPLAGSWLLTSTNVTNTMVSADAFHSGTGSLHVVFATGGNTGTHVSQDVSNLNATATHTLSFWYRPSATASSFTARFSTLFRPQVNSRLVTATPGTTNATAGALPAYPLLFLNEVQPENPDGYKDNTYTPQPWVELFNAGTNFLSLDGFFLSGGYSNLNQWAFPTGTVIAPGEMRVVFVDGQPALSTGTVLHANFRLDATNGSIALSRAGLILDYLNYSNLQSGFSFGAFEDGQVFDRQIFFYTTPGASNNPSPIPVAINEWMASNTRTLQNPGYGNRYDDWFELYNFGSTAIDLGGYFLTDDLDNKTKSVIPPGTVIAPHSFLMVWADNDSSGTNTVGNAIHVNFQLSRNGDQIGFFDPAGVLIDSLNFGTQTSDVSQGRFADGNVGGVLHFMPLPTPGTPNNIGGNHYAPMLTPIPDFVIDEGALLSFTNAATDADVPAQQLSFTLPAGAPVGAQVGAASGVFSWTPSEAQGPGMYPMAVRVIDNGVPSLSDTQTFNVEVREVNSTPTLAPISNRVIYEGSSLLITNAVIDLDMPANTLGFTLSNAPLGAMIQPASGIFAWTPQPAQAGQTNTLSVRVSDNGLPQMFDEKTFTVIVLPRPRVTSIEVSSNTLTLTWSTSPGMRYRLQYSDSVDATSWNDLETDLLAQGLMLSRSLTISTTGQRFFRIAVEP